VQMIQIDLLNQKVRGTSGKIHVHAGPRIFSRRLTHPINREAINMDTPRNNGNNTGAEPQRIQAYMAEQPPVQPSAQAFGQNDAVMPQGMKMTETGNHAQEEVVAVRKNGDGDIVELKLTSGRVVDYKTAQAMVKNNEIRNLNVFRGRDGEEHLRSDPDGREDNNLDNLPTF